MQIHESVICDKGYSLASDCYNIEYLGGGGRIMMTMNKNREGNSNHARQRIGKQQSCSGGSRTENGNRGI